MSYVFTLLTGRYGIDSVVLFVCLIVVIWIVVLQARMSRLHKVYRRLVRGTTKSSIEQLLITYADDVHQTAGQMKDIVTNIESLTEQLHSLQQRHLIEPSIVRFNAFSENGSDLSYAVAFVNTAGNGVVLSSIYGRDESRTYAKPIVKGQSTYALTNEEKEAIQKASEKL